MNTSFCPHMRVHHFLFPDVPGRSHLFLSQSDFLNAALSPTNNTPVLRFGLFFYESVIMTPVRAPVFLNKVGYSPPEVSLELWMSACSGNSTGPCLFKTDLTEASVSSLSPCCHPYSLFRWSSFSYCTICFEVYTPGEGSCATSL